MKSLLLLLLAVLALQKGIQLKGDLFVRNDLRANVLYLEKANSSLTCISVMSESLESDSLSGEEVDADNVEVSHVYPRTQDFIKMYGHMSISGALQVPPSSFLQVGE